jgi:hypothetical protein
MMWLLYPYYNFNKLKKISFISLGFGWKRQPPDMEGSCEYTESADKGWSSSLGVV